MMIAEIRFTITFLKMQNLNENLFKMLQSNFNMSQLTIFKSFRRFKNTISM